MRLRNQYTVILSLFLMTLLFVAGCKERSGDAISQVSNGKGGDQPAADTVLINEGKILFNNNCHTCHFIGRTDNHLEGCVERLGVDNCKLFLTKEDSLVKAKNEYVLRLKKAYGNQKNNHNYSFTKEELNSIIAFLKKYLP